MGLSQPDTRTPVDRPIVAGARPGLPGVGIRQIAETMDLRVWTERRPPTPDELVDLVAPAHGLICQPGDRVGSELLARAPHLRVLSTTGVGFENLDLAALNERGIAAGNTQGVLTETTADLAFGLILAASRRFGEAERLVRSGEWIRSDYDLLLGQDVWGRRLGIVGYGAIGQAVARRGRGFGMSIAYHSRRPVEGDEATWLPLAELLATSDVVSVHVPLTPSTRGLIGQAEIALMRPDAVFVNTSRGAVVDQTALAAALEDGRLFAAGLDVTAREPTPLDDPILRAPRCVVLPHIGSATKVTRERMVDLAVANVSAGLRGDRLPSGVNPEVYDSPLWRGTA